MNLIRFDSEYSKGTKLLCALSFGLGSCLTLVFAPLGTSLFDRICSAKEAGQDLNDSQPAAITKLAKAEPWGRIEAFVLPFANPGGVYVDSAPRLQPTTWLFENATESSVVRFLESCDLPRLHKRVLLDKKYWTVSSNGCTISPPNQLLWFLAPHSREQLYTVLGKWAANYPQAFPFRFSDQRFEVRFQHSGLLPGKINLIKGLTYRKRGELCFSDLKAAEDLLEPAEFQSLLEALYAIPAYALRLHVEPDSDVAGLAKYWGKGGREKRIAPLLQALAKVPGGESINVTSLLPLFARLRLYTYPDAWKDETVRNQDCFFSALNFFNETEDTNFLNPTYIQEVLDSEYASISDNPSFGDLMVLMNSDAQPIHVCVFIAEDFVFTKNGVNPGQPWVLMKLPDILATYFDPKKPAHILCLRHKDSGQA